MSYFSSMFPTSVNPTSGNNNKKNSNSLNNGKNTKGNNTSGKNSQGNNTSGKNTKVNSSKNLNVNKNSVTKKSRRNLKNNQFLPPEKTLIQIKKKRENAVLKEKERIEEEKREEEEEELRRIIEINKYWDAVRKRQREEEIARRAQVPQYRQYTERDILYYFPHVLESHATYHEIDTEYFSRYLYYHNGNPPPRGDPRIYKEFTRPSYNSY